MDSEHATPVSRQTRAWIAVTYAVLAIAAVVGNAGLPA